MSKIIILEGMSTSGKSLVQSYLKENYEQKGKSVLIVDEKEGLNVLLDKKNRSLKNSINVLKNLIIEKTKLKYDYIVFDRFHISHNGTLDSNFEDFSEIEELLLKHDSRIIYLHVNKNQIIKRMRKCLETTRKNSSFETFFKNRVITDCNSLKEEDKKIYDFYSKRINQHLEDLKKTKLNCLKVNVSKFFLKEEYIPVYEKVINFIEK
jgi:thymidylate kinase